ncbi:MAG: CcmD family protein [Ferruginibacter sp.]
MHKYFYRFSLLFINFFMWMASFAQDKPVEMADSMRANGKIYVVVAVCLIILTGLFLYVMGIDRKLRSLEKEKV